MTVSVWILVLIMIVLLVSVDVASEKTIIEEGNCGVGDTFVSASISPGLSKYWDLLDKQQTTTVRSGVVINVDAEGLKEFIASQCDKFGVDLHLALAIISCEGGFTNPSVCNRQYGCSGGQGHFQFIPNTWTGTVARMSELEEDRGLEVGSLLPLECRTSESVFNSHCNIIGGVWLLATDGTSRWGTADTWWGSYHCWINKV